VNVTHSMSSQALSRIEVFNVIREKHVLSRSKLAELVSVSRATVSSIVSDLLQSGLLEEVGEGESTGGRPPIHLRYRPEGRQVIGLLVYDHQIQAALTDLEGHPLHFLKVPVSSSQPEEMLNAMQSAIQELLENPCGKQVIGIGVGVPGIVNFDSGVIETSVGMGWIDQRVEVKEVLHKKFGLPVHVANRSRVAALGELKAGVGKDSNNLIYLFLGKGIVAGIVIDGKLYFGSGFDSGEIGHVSIDPNGPLCACGNHGCFELHSSEKAILARARLLARNQPESKMAGLVDGYLENLTFEHILTAAQAEDPAALETLDEAGRGIGFAISILINLFAPNMVILGGPLGGLAGDFLLTPAINEARNRTISRSFHATQIRTGSLGTDALVIGAATLAIQNLYIDSLFS
jgi:glucokinase-like ROK family protein